MGSVEILTAPVTQRYVGAYFRTGQGLRRPTIVGPILSTYLQEHEDEWIGLSKKVARDTSLEWVMAPIGRPDHILSLILVFPTGAVVDLESELEDP